MSEARQRIIATASELFYRKGYNSTGIDEVIREADVAKATLYKHFRSKKDLCVAYLQTRETAFIDGLTQAIGRQPQGRTRVLAIFDFLADFYETPDFTGCWAMRTASEVPEGHEAVRGEVVRQKQRLIDFFERVLAEAGAAEGRRLPLSSKQLYIVYEGAVAECYMHSADWPLREARDLVEQIVS